MTHPRLHFAKWTEQEDDLLKRMFRAGCSVEQVAMTLNRSERAVVQRHHQLTRLSSPKVHPEVAFAKAMKGKRFEDIRLREFSTSQ